MLQNLLKGTAKSGAIAAILLLGTTGALVAASVQTGVTTLTETPSASPSASASASHTASASPSGSHSPRPSSSHSANACEQQAHTAATAVDRVNDAFHKYHEGIERLRERARTEAQRDDLAAADKLLKQIRRDAVKQIHATMTCKDEDADNDNDENEDKDNDKDDHTASPSPSAHPSASPTAAPSASASSSPSGDPKTIADNAIAAMKLVFDKISAEFPAPSSSPSARPTREQREGHSTTHEHD